MAVELVVAGIFGLLSVAFGAFGTHALRARLPAERVQQFQTGVHYQTVHALAALLAGVFWLLGRGRALDPWAGGAFLVGATLFSGALYVLALTGRRGFGAVAPMGGLILLAGWALLAVGLAR